MSSIKKQVKVKICNNPVIYAKYDLEISTPDNPNAEVVDAIEKAMRKANVEAAIESIKEKYKSITISNHHAGKERF